MEKPVVCDSKGVKPCHETRYHKELAAFDGKEYLFGRHYTFLQELGEVSIIKTWKEADAFTRPNFGKADVQAMAPDGTKLIAGVKYFSFPAKLGAS